MATVVQTYRIEGVIVSVQPVRPGSGTVSAGPRPPGGRPGAHLEGLQVEAWQIDAGGAAFLETSFTNAAGEFRMTLDEPMAARAPLDLAFKVFRHGDLIHDTAAAPLRNVQPGITEVRLVVAVGGADEPASPAEPRFEDFAFQMPGALRTPEGHPIAGMRVEARMSSARGQSPDPDAGLLGETISDVDGRFSIPLRNTAAVLRDLVSLRRSRAATFRLRVLDAGGAVIAQSPPLHARSRFPVTVEVPQPADDLTASEWRRIGERLEAAGVARIHEVANHLLGMGSASQLGDLPAALRRRAALALERAVLDPSGELEARALPLSFSVLRAPGALERNRDRIVALAGDPDLALEFVVMQSKLRDFHDLFDIDWVLDVNELKAGKVRAAASKFAPSYSGRPEAGPAPGMLIPGDADLIGYRDYLRQIFTGEGGSPGFTERLQLLGDRFKQSFSTRVTALAPANAVVIPIIEAALTAPTGSGYGFGVAPGAIEAQGQRTDREYLDHLIALSGESARELELRYRLDLRRGDHATSSPVLENIATLQSFYEDGFQSDEEPHAIIPADFLGKAPFFLTFEEWRDRRSAFFAENLFALRRTYHVNLGDLAGKKREFVLLHAEQAAEEDDPVRRLAVCIAVEDQLAEAHRLFDLGQYELAADAYDAAAGTAFQAVDWTNPSYTVSRLEARFQELMSMPMATEEDLEEFTRAFAVRIWPPGDTDMNIGYVREWVEEKDDDLTFMLVHLLVYGMRVYRGDIALARGEFAEAAREYSWTTRFPIGRAAASDRAGYQGERHSHGGPFGGGSIPEVQADQWGFALYATGELAYTADVSLASSLPDYVATGPTWAQGVAHRTATTHLHTMLNRFFRLRHGEALLEWADALYRSDDPSAVQRARELYKAVLFLHGRRPPIDPHWPVDSVLQKIAVKALAQLVSLQSDGNGGSDSADTSSSLLQGASALASAVSFHHHSANPAQQSQTARASKGLTQIEEGLNFYGFNDDMIPTLRYRPLKDAADRLAAAARGAQQDFLIYTAKVEDALRDGIIHANLLAKAALQGRIAREQAGIAAFGVQLAEAQVAQVEAAITAKEKEIEEKEELFTQLSDFFSGMVDTLKGNALWKEGAGTVGGAVSAGSGGGAAAGGAEAAGLTGAAAGGSVLGAYAILVYAGVASLKSMEEAHEQRKDELKKLKEKALPLAQAQVRARRREVAIARLQEQVAEADAQLARELIRFQQLRFLNVELWGRLGRVVNRIMRRYLELGGRYAWLAERALAFEQDRTLDLIRLNYIPRDIQGLTGADLLAADLAELESVRLDGLRRSVALQRTYSLAFDFPLAFAQLRRTGRCTFDTAEAPLRLAHPGLWGYRIQSIRVRTQTTAAIGVLRGVLRNSGFSLVSREDGTERAVLRAADGQPVYGPVEEPDASSLPTEPLRSFEGSGIETRWSLELPAQANPHGLQSLADVFITIDMRAHFSEALYFEHVAAQPSSVHRSVVASAVRHAPGALQSLAGGAQSVDLMFDVAALPHPAAEASRTIRNLALLVAGAAPDAFTAPVHAVAANLTVQTPFVGGIALSNADPLSNGQPPQPLNAFVGLDADQPITITLGPGPVPGVSFEQIVDVLLVIEYEAAIA